MEVIVDADTRLVVAAARRVPGTDADAHAWRASGLSEHCQGGTVLGDGAYQVDDAAGRNVQARVAHVIGRMKNNKILRDCRRSGDGLHHGVQAIAHIHNLALASCPEDRDHSL